MERTWEIKDATGHKRRVTLAEFRADIEARKVSATPIMAAWRAGDMQAVADAQTAMRKRFA